MTDEEYESAYANGNESAYVSIAQELDRLGIDVPEIAAASINEALASIAAYARLGRRIIEESELEIHDETMPHHEGPNHFLRVNGAIWVSDQDRADLLTVKPDLPHPDRQGEPGT